jgi:hypothetical protein
MNTFVSSMLLQGQIVLSSLCAKDLQQEIIAPGGDLAFSFDAVFGGMLFQQTDRKSTKPR